MEPGSEVVKKRNDTELATFGGGCFWCTEAVFKRTDGVLSIVSGYAGGVKPNPTYEEVCSGSTGHAEVIQIEFEPDRVSYEELLALFWKSHDPTSVNRQGADVGTQYRSIILTHTENQARAATSSKEERSSQYPRPVVTEIKEMDVFYPAEDYHQHYFERNPDAGYCRFVIAPKLQKLGIK